MEASTRPECLCHVEEKRLRMEPADFEREYGHLGPCGSVDRTSSLFQLMRAKALRSKNRDQQLATLQKVDTQAAKFIATDGAEMVPVCMNHCNAESRNIVTLERLFEYGRDVNDGEAPGMARRISLRRMIGEKRALAKLIKQQRADKRDVVVKYRAYNNNPNKQPIRFTDPAQQGIEIVGHNETVEPDTIGPTVIPTSFAVTDPTAAPVVEEQAAPVIPPRGDAAPKPRGWKRKDNQ